MRQALVERLRDIKSLPARAKASKLLRNGQNEHGAVKELKVSFDKGNAILDIQYKRRTMRCLIDPTGKGVIS